MALTQVPASMADRSLPTTVVATNTTLAADSYYYVSAATVTVTLPASPTAGQHVSIAIGNFTDIVVARNGSNIMSLAEDLTMDTAYLSIQFIYTDSTRGWIIS